MRIPASTVVAIALLALGAALASCSADAEASRCSDSDDCDATQLCQLGACFDACERQDDCESGRTCVSGICASADRCGEAGACDDGFVCEGGWCVAQQAECARSSECPPGFLCVDGGCRLPDNDAGLQCVTRDDCGADEACVDNVCTPRSIEDAGTPDAEPADAADADTSLDDVARPDATPEDTAIADTPGPDSGPCSFSTDCPDGFICDEFVCVPEGADVGVDTNTPDTPTCGVFDDRCAAAADCCSGMCVPDAVGAATGFCSETCASWADCNPAGRRDDFACVTVDNGAGGIDVCVPSDFESRCDSVSDCLGGICLRTPGDSACTWECNGGADCPDGTACGIAEFAGGDVRFVCMPIGNPCLTQDNCLSQTCVTPDTGGVGTCTALCRADTNPCPPPYACVEVDPSLPGVTVCTLP